MLSVILIVGENDMRIDKYMEVVDFGLKPDREKQYNEWYNRHITEVFAFGGLKRISRSKCYRPLGDFEQPSPLYLTIYEFDAPEYLDAFYEHPLMADARIHFDEEAPKSVDIYWTGFYGSIKTLEK